jgi:hypothetical protein
MLLEELDVDVDENDGRDGENKEHVSPQVHGCQIERKKSTS